MCDWQKSNMTLSFEKGKKKTWRTTGQVVSHLYLAISLGVSTGDYAKIHGKYEGGWWQST